MKEMDLKPGMNLKISLIDNQGDILSPSYTSKLQHIDDNNSTLEIDIPDAKSIQKCFGKDTMILVTLAVGGGGIFSFHARVTGVNQRNKVPVMVIRQETELFRVQRRSYYRLQYSCEVKYRPFKLPALGSNEEQFRTTNTIDVSGGGMCLLTSEKLEKNIFLECVIILEKDVEIKAVGKIVDTKEENTGGLTRWKNGIQFERISENSRERIISFVFREQQRLRRKGLV